MRKIQTLLLLLLGLPLLAHAQSAVTNQNLFDTDPFLPDHYQKRLQMFKNQPATTGQVLFLGDSITEGGSWGKLLNDSSVLNRGIGGDVTFGVLDRLDEVTAHKPSKLFLMIGINDIGKDIPDAVVADNCRKIIKQIQAKSPQTQIYLQSLLPVNPEYPNFPQHYNKEYHVIRTNQLLRKVATEVQVHFINLFPLFLNAQGRMARELTTDGLHLNKKGYKIWVRYLQDNGYL